MSRNKKNESDFRLGHVALAVVLFALFVPPGIGFVWFKDQIDVMADQVKQKEAELGRLQRENRSRSDQLAALCLPEALDKQVKKMNLGLDRPSQSQIVRLIDAPNEPAPAPSPDPHRVRMVASEANY